MIDFGNPQEKLKGEYLDMYDRVRSEVSHTIKFNENSDLSLTYLGRIYMTKSGEIKVKKDFLYQTRLYNRKIARWY